MHLFSRMWFLNLFFKLIRCQEEAHPEPRYASEAEVVRAMAGGGGGEGMEEEEEDGFAARRWAKLLLEK